MAASQLPRPNPLLTTAKRWVLVLVKLVENGLIERDVIIKVTITSVAQILSNFTRCQLLKTANRTKEEKEIHTEQPSQNFTQYPESSP